MKLNAEGVRGKAAPKKLSKAVVACVRRLQESAALEMTCNIQSRVLMEAFKREREGARGWMRGVLLGWREVVEHSTPVVRDDSTRWRVRRVGDTCRRANNDKLQRSQALRVSCREAASRVCAARLQRAADAAVGTSEAAVAAAAAAKAAAVAAAAARVPTAAAAAADNATAAATAGSTRNSRQTHACRFIAKRLYRNEKKDRENSRTVGTTAVGRGSTASGAFPKGE